MQMKHTLIRHKNMKTETKKDLTPLGRFNLDKVFASIILDTRREKEKGYYPVKFRVTFLRKQVYYPCMDVNEDEFDRLHGIIRGENLAKTKKLILAHFKRLTDTIEDLVKSDGFTFAGLNTRLSKGVKDSVLTVFDNKIADLTVNGKIGTAAWYTCAKNSIEKYSQKDVKFSDITVNWLKSYEKHLLDEGKEYTTVSINMRALRAIVNFGLANGIISQGQYPFVVKNNGKYRIPEGTGRKIALNTEQLLKVFDYPLLAENEKWRDLFVFSFYCNGANISDILRFKYENIVGNYIEWYRGKTRDTDRKKIKIRAAITPEMQIIIDKYGNSDKRPGNYIFPYLTHGLTPTKERMIIQDIIHLINKRMKAIGQALGIGDVTSYWARHTWASISRHEGVSLYGISKGMGHKSLSTTQIYLDSLSDEEINENAAKLPRRNNGK